MNPPLQTSVQFYVLCFQPKPFQGSPAARSVSQFTPREPCRLLAWSRTRHLHERHRTLQLFPLQSITLPPRGITEVRRPPAFFAVVRSRRGALTRLSDTSQKSLHLLSVNCGLPDACKLAPNFTCSVSRLGWASSKAGGVMQVLQSRYRCVLF